MPQLINDMWWDVFQDISGSWCVAIGSGRRGSKSYDVIDARYGCANQQQAYLQKNMWLTEYGISDIRINSQPRRIR